MSWSRLEWACGTVAPWCLAAGLLVSFTADAGQDPAALIPRSAVVGSGPIIAADALTAGERTFFASIVAIAPRLPDGFILRQASLVIGEPEDLRALPDEIDPRTVLKSDTPQAFPAIDRSHKGDPTVGLRPGFEAQWDGPGSHDARVADRLIFSTDEDSLPAGALMHGEPTTAEAATHLKPWPQGDNSTTERATGVASPRAATAARTATAADGGALRTYAGATPAVPRAVALSSTTPAAADNIPIEISVIALPRVESNSSLVTRIARPLARPDYAALIDSDRAAHEQRCLAEAIYFEARSEPEAGQAAVAQVVLNRVNSGLYPTTVCGVVYQNRNRHLACQFSFACEGRSLRINEPDSWRQAVRVAHQVTDGTTYLADIGDATHYHANYVRPFWAKRLQRMDRIGHHIFYKLRPGQT
jgi:spore germination cell wall hydrolase CwlJ-like protein